MKVFYWVSVLYFFNLCSCTKPQRGAEQQLSDEKEDRPYQSTIVACGCLDNKENDFNFKATINSKNLCLNTDFKQGTFNNSWVKSSWQNEIFMLKKDADSAIGIAIKYNNPAFYKHSLPYQIDKGSHDSCEVITISIMNFKYAKFCDCPADDSNYESLTSIDNVSVKIISFKDSILEGTYSGDFRNRGGRKFSVTNGYFKTSLKAQNQ